MTNLRPTCSKKKAGTCSHSPNCHVQAASLAPEILVVEDGSGLFAKIGALLQTRGFQVILAPDAATALQEMENYDIGAVIAGASSQQTSGLHVLAAAREKQAGIKTVAVTSLDDPQLDPQAYEMDLDDYLHWPMSSAALTARLAGLLGVAAEPGIPGVGPEELAPDCGPAQTLAVSTFLVDRFTESLAAISKSLEEIRQSHREGMATELSADLLALTANIQYLSDKIRQVWHFQSDEATSSSGQPLSFH